MPPAAPPDPGGVSTQRRRERSDLSILARGGTLIILGNIFSGLTRTAFFVLTARALGPAGSGELVEAIAVFTLLLNFAELGADTGLARMIPRYRAQGRTQDLRRTLDISVWPVLLIGAVLGGLALLFAPQLARIFIHGANRADAETYIRIFAIAVPFGAAMNIALAATRGYGTMMPYVAIADALMPVSRLVLALATLAGVGVVAISLGWTVPVIAWGLVSIWFAYRLTRRAEINDRYERGPARKARDLAGEFWRFSAPRALAGFFQVVVFGIDVLLLGALRTTSEASIYNAAGRLTNVVTSALAAIGLAVAPQIAHLLTRRETQRAERVFQAATWWAMAASWPLGLALAVWAPVVLKLFGPKFVAGHTALVIVALAMLVQVGTGNNRIVLLMGGRSGLNLLFSGGALVINVVLNLLLIPHLGMNGAAIAWAVTILVDNGATTYAIWKLLDLNPFGSGYPFVVGASVLCYGVIGLAFRLVFRAAFGPMVLAGVAGTLVYVALLWRFREQLHLPIFRELLKVRRLVANRTSFDAVDEAPLEPTE